MSTPEPKFSVGEVVMVRNQKCPEFNQDAVTVIDVTVAKKGDAARLVNPDGTAQEGFLAESYVLYRHDLCRDWVDECTLKKRPPPADKEFAEDLKEMLGGVVKQGEKV